MHQQLIRSVPSWRHAAPQHGCVFVETDAALPGMQGLLVAQVFLFFKFSYRDIVYPCALVHWFEPVGNEPCPDTGMWIVRPTFRGRFKESRIIPISSIYRAAHLLPIYKTGYKVPRTMSPEDTLDSFKAFYVNKYIDHHAFEIAR